MWIIVATVLLLYLLGFLFICFLNVEKHGNPSSTDNNSLSASNTNDETENFCQRHHLSRYHRLFLNRLLSSNFRYDEDEEAGTSGHASSADGGSSSRQVQSSSDPSRSALFAYRQQQLRQIHHEINEMSYLLGASQSHSDRRAQSVPVPIQCRTNLVQPLRNLGNNTSNYFNICASANRSRYSFVHQLMSPLPCSSSTTSTTLAAAAAADSATTGDAVIMSNNPGTFTNSSSSTVIPTNNSSSISTPGGSITYHSCGSSSLSYSPSGSESCHIFQERQRRLRHIRMELEGLSLQLSHADDRSAGSGGMTSPLPPTLLLHGTAVAAAAAANNTSSSLLMSVSPSSAGTTFGMENNLADSSSFIYFGQGSASIINGSSWSDDNDDLPGYESIVCLVDSRQRVDDSSSGSGVERGEESPPPSYNDVVHLYSFGEPGGKRK